MDIKTVYLLGPMTGHEDDNYPAFYEAAGVLREKGYVVINPAEMGRDDSMTWEQYLDRDLNIILTKEIHAGVALTGWHLSRGAQLEAHAILTRELPLLQYPDLKPLPVNPTWEWKGE